MPAGPITFTTLTGSPAQPNDQVFEPSADITAAAATANLIAGNNLIAVEVHQQSLTSSDIAKAVQVLVKRETVDAAAVVSAVYLDESGNLLIDIAGDNVYVQETLSLTPTAWTTIAGPLSSGTFNAGPATGERYLRLSDTP
jgi:hypothetical protein